MSDKIKAMDSYQKVLNKKRNELNLYKFGRYYAERQNSKIDLLEEEYKELPIPTELNKWFNTYSEELNIKEKKKKRRSTIKNYASKAAVFLLVLLLSSAVVTLSVDAFRVKFLNLFIESGSDHNRIDFVESDDLIKVPEGWLNFYYPTYIPEGYRLMDANSSGTTKIAIFINEENELIVFTQNANEMGMNIDSEQSAVDIVPINSNDGYMTEKDGIINISWSDNGMVFAVEGDAEISIMIKIAEKIKKVSK